MGTRSAQTRLTKTVSGFVLNGTKRFVYDGDAATSFICAARTETGGVALALVDRNAPGVSVKPAQAL
jgi:alkylation response protein AidB-like acyl-CoA dehydrogenase